MKPKIDVYPSATLNPQNPFVTPFILENTGPFTIKTIQYQNYIADITCENGGRANNIVVQGAGTIDDLASSGKTTIGFIQGAIGIKSPVKTATASISVTYKPFLYFKPINQTFTFSIRHTSSGECIWFPEDGQN